MALDPIVRAMINRGDMHRGFFSLAILTYHTDSISPKS
jgi:hypothetical protein